MNYKCYEKLQKSLNSRVPFIFCSNEYKIAESTKDYQLRDIAPTILYLLDIKKPKQMTGSSIVAYK